VFAKIPTIGTQKLRHAHPVLRPDALLSPKEKNVPHLIILIKSQNFAFYALPMLYQLELRPKMVVFVKLEIIGVKTLSHA
jgi:hypothetical protein